ncbi:MAG: 4-(cytidine 5'-diphospho)-2-C-methyl-D-erythritol kinase [Spirochaetaceae bacterium]|nr:4-(cytidine 5'-diphospho)-2-C-methyl-D-erythritol kinase [Spirochaetaceae bacterium]
MVIKNSINVLAPAKINLHLAVGKKRIDNFHSLQSIFARIALFDEINIKVYDSNELEISILGLDNIQLRGEDTLTKATRLWAKSANINDKIVISIKKNIPFEAGLGGGSSDGASVLLALQKLYPNSALSFRVLEEIASQIGSDVPFFLYEATFAYITGRGEFVTPIDMKAPYKVHLVKPERGIKTKNAFLKLDNIVRVPFILDEKLLSIFNEGVSAWKEYFFNDFERVIKNDVLDRVKNPNNFLLLSGSGSACFEIMGISDNPSLIAKKGEFDCITTFY